MTTRTQYSRKHITNTPHMTARANWDATKSPEAKRLRADTRQALRASRSNKAQAALLDQRLGFGVGAVKERNRLSPVG